MRLRVPALLCFALAAADAAACSAPSVEGTPLGSGSDVPDRVSSTPQVDASPGDSDPGQVDASTPPQDAGVDANRQRVVFVSSAVINANLGGLAGADATCAALAAAQGRTGTFRAWLSVSGNSAADRITSDGPWHLVTGELVAATKAELVSGTLRRAPNKDEKGNTAPAVEDRVWTATAASGAFSGPECTAWTGAGSGRVGEANFADGRWTSSDTEACSQINRVYCFEL